MIILDKIAKKISAAIAMIAAGTITLIDSMSVIKSTSKKGKDLIKSFESLKLTSYLCPTGHWTIGWGHTANVREGQTITEKQAETLFLNDLKVFEDGVNRLVNKQLTQNQFDALVSFAFNLGLNNLKKSTLLKLVNENPNNPDIRTEFAKWRLGNGVVLPGLVRRREEEANLYFS
ncbi:MAG: lysozyme [Paludibacteraceae bacterium]|nr:lysozyme [Paludibacteraceae bacterium]